MQLTHIDIFIDVSLTFLDPENMKHSTSCVTADNNQASILSGVVSEDSMTRVYTSS